MNHALFRDVAVALFSCLAALTFAGDLIENGVDWKDTAGNAISCHLETSRYLWLPVSFDPATGRVKLEYKAQWNPLSTKKLDQTQR